MSTCAAIKDLFGVKIELPVRAQWIGIGWMIGSSSSLQVK